jgi:hypothetical protein
MLSLSGSLFAYEGVLVARDYHDPRQFHYFPKHPHLAVDEHGRPAIRLLVFKEDLDDLPPEREHAAGWLIFDTSLAWPEETLQKVARRIEEDLDLDGPARLVPLSFKNGTTRLLFLDRSTTPPDGDPPPGGEPPRQDWVTFLEASGIPSYYGENRAVFSVMLSKRAVEMVLGAFEGFMPAGIIYDLGFVGIQRGFNVHATAHWEEVYHYLSNRFQLDVLVFDTDVQSVVEELISKQVIKIEAVSEDEGMEGELSAVRKQVQELVLDRFFKPAPNPNEPPDRSIPDGIVDVARDLRDLGSAVTGGFTRREVDASELRSIEVDYTVDRAVERRIAPQAHLSLFFEDFALSRDQVVTVVTGDDDLWRELELSVTANADFEGDGLFGVNVDVAYGQPGTGGTPGPDSRLWSTLFTRSGEVAKKSAWYDPDVGNRFQYRYQPLFSSGAVDGPELALDSGWQQSQGNVVVITPRELYRQRRVEFQLAKSFPFELYPQVHVQLAYTDQNSGWSHQHGSLLDADHLSAEHTFRIHHDASAELTYRLTFAHAGGPVRSDWMRSSDELILVADPRPNLFTVRAVVAGDRSKLDQLILDFEYEDAPAEILETKTLVINQRNLGDPHAWTFPRADPSRHRYTYSQTLIDTDGNLLTTGRVQDDRAVLPVGVVYAKRWDVQPELVGPSLAANGLEKVKLRLRYEDLTNGYRADKELVFSEPGRGESWHLELRDPAAREYTYEVRYVLQTGFERKLGPLSSSDTFLMIPSTPPVP